jgi:hypothetical protein
MDTRKFFLGAFAKLRKATISFVMPVRPSSWNSANNGQIYIQFNLTIFRKSVHRRIQISLKSDKNNGVHLS